jgi:hypothetical protein
MAVLLRFLDFGMYCFETGDVKKTFVRALDFRCCMPGNEDALCADTYGSTTPGSQATFAPPWPRSGAFNEGRFLHLKSVVAGRKGVFVGILDFGMHCFKTEALKKTFLT